MTRAQSWQGCLRSNQTLGLSGSNEVNIDEAIQGPVTGVAGNPRPPAPGLRDGRGGAGVPTRSPAGSRRHHHAGFQRLRRQTGRASRCREGGGTHRPEVSTARPGDSREQPRFPADLPPDGLESNDRDGLHDRRPETDRGRRLHAAHVHRPGVRDGGTGVRRLRDHDPSLQQGRLSGLPAGSGRVRRIRRDRRGGQDGGRRGMGSEGQGGHPHRLPGIHRRAAGGLPFRGEHVLQDGERAQSVAPGRS